MWISLAIWNHHYPGHHHGALFPGLDPSEIHTFLAILLAVWKLCLKSPALTRGTYLGFSSGKDPGVSAQIFCTDTILSVGINILDFWYFLIDFESTTLTLSTFWDFSPRNDPGVLVTILCPSGGAQMPRSDAKRFSSSLKACPLTKAVMKEVRREEEEGMEMAGEFPACKRDDHSCSCNECGKSSTFTGNLNDHKNCVQENGGRVSCLREQGGQKRASSCKEKRLHLEITFQ